METSSLAHLKKELNTMAQPQLVELMIRLGKYKKENKELLHYLLFESHDEQTYINNIKAEVEEQFKEVNRTTVYFAKKTIRKILRGIGKHIKYSSKSETTVELLIHFLKQFKKLPNSFYDSTVIINMYAAQLKKINKELGKLHEDIQYDYRKEIDNL
jgi:hypothetical protein